METNKDQKTSTPTKVEAIELTPGPVWPTPDTPWAGSPVTITGLTFLKFE